MKRLDTTFSGFPRGNFIVKMKVLDLYSKDGALCTKDITGDSFYEKGS